MANVNRKGIVYWLENIYNSLLSLSSSVSGSHQSDWTENDQTSESFIKNKPTVYPCLIVNGHKESAFIPGANQPSKDDCIACINAGGVVYLVNKVSDSEIHKELVISVDTVAKTFTTANMTW